MAEDGTIQDSRMSSGVSRFRHSSENPPKPVNAEQWGYIKVKDPRILKPPQGDDEWNEYVVYVSDGEIPSKENVKFELKQAKLTVQDGDGSIEADIIAAVVVR